MAIKPRDLINYAKRILDHHGCETHYRNVVGRAYYGAFLTARNKAQEMSDETFDSGGAHKKLVKFYEGVDLSIANRLNDLRIRRMKADYKLNKKCSYYDANSSCKRAETLIEECEREL